MHSNTISSSTNGFCLLTFYDNYYLDWSSRLLIYTYILCSKDIRRVLPLNRYLFFPYFRPHRFSKTINLIQVMLQPRKSTSLKDYLLIAEDIKDYCRQCINQYGNLTLTYIQPKYVTKYKLIIARNTT